MGFKIWLTVHYSDTWADPGSQITPIDWQGVQIEDLRDSVYNYTKKIVSEIENGMEIEVNEHQLKLLIKKTN